MTFEICANSLDYHYKNQHLTELQQLQQKLSQRAHLQITQLALFFPYTLLKQHLKPLKKLLFYPQPHRTVFSCLSSSEDLHTSAHT